MSNNKINYILNEIIKVTTNLNSKIDVVSGDILLSTSQLINDVPYLDAKISGEFELSANLNADVDNHLGISSTTGNDNYFLNQKGQWKLLSGGGGGGGVTYSFNYPLSSDSNNSVSFVSSFLDDKFEIKQNLDSDITALGYIKSQSDPIFTALSSNFALSRDIPLSTSQLINDKEFITSGNISGELKNTGVKLSGEIVDWKNQAEIFTKAIQIGVKNYADQTKNQIIQIPFYDENEGTLLLNQLMKEGNGISINNYSQTEEQITKLYTNIQLNIIPSSVTKIYDINNNIISGSLDNKFIRFGKEYTSGNANQFILVGITDTITGAISTAKQEISNIYATKMELSANTLNEEEYQNLMNMLSGIS